MRFHVLNNHQTDTAVLSGLVG